MSDKNTPTEDQIRVRAYEIYLARGGEDGRDLSDWIETERELSGLIEPLRAAGTQKARSAVAGQKA